MTFQRGPITRRRDNLRAGTVVSRIARGVSSPVGEAGGGGAEYLAAVLEDSPVAYWRLDEPAGTTGAGSVVDEIEVTNGTPSGDITFGITGAVLQATTFDGSTGYISTGTLGTLGSSATLTVECWLRWTVTTGRMAAMGLADGAQDMILFTNAAGSTGITERTGGLVFRRRTSVGRGRDSIRSDLNDGEWHHCVGVYAALDGYPDIYIDGVLDNGTISGYSSVVGGNWGVPLMLGAYNEIATPLRFFAGSVDEVALYATALSEARIAAHYAAR